MRGTLRPTEKPARQSQTAAPGREGTPGPTHRHRRSRPAPASPLSILTVAFYHGWPAREVNLKPASYLAAPAHNGLFPQDRSKLAKNSIVPWYWFRRFAQPGRGPAPAPIDAIQTPRPRALRKPTELRWLSETAAMASNALASAGDIRAFIDEYFEAWSGTDEDRILSYYAETVSLEIPGTFETSLSAPLSRLSRKASHHEENDLRRRRRTFRIRLRG